tara:strand:+ start:120 stop:299 length:180 start_codon:yes stop_codon:yes gene_type:complete
MEIIFVSLVGVFVLVFILVPVFKKDKKEQRRKIRFEDLSAKQKRYVLRRLKEKQRKENK